MNKRKVLIVDDQAISRRFFELTIAESNRYEVAFSVASAFAVDIYLLRENIDLVLLDVLMYDGSNGLDAAEKIKQIDPDIKIVVVTSMPEYSWMERARSIGVDSFWYKEAQDHPDILEVLDRTMAGESVYPSGAPSVRLGNALREDFTGREMEVLREITAGKSNSSIAKTLNVTENTVKAHVRSILAKTGYSSRTELAVNARAVGISLKL